MFTITSSSLADFIQKQLDSYFTDSHEVELEKKVVEMTATIEELIREVIKIDPQQKNEFDGWQQNFSVFENSLCKLEELKQKTIIKESDVIGRVSFQLKQVLSDCEELFPSKTIGMTDWNNKRENLINKISSLKNEDVNRMLHGEEIIAFLNLSPLNQCTSELGYYKQFAQGINDMGKSFSNIFYLLKNNEVSYFHKLGTTETWTWFGKSPLSLFILENDQLIEHVLSESNQSVTIPSQTWFSAAIKNVKKQNLAEDDIPFTLVTCYCTPAFTLSCYHDDIMHDEDSSILLINAYRKADPELQSNIINLLAPPYQEEFKQRISY